jgi:hypothetical protein
MRGAGNVVRVNILENREAPSSTLAVVLYYTAKDATKAVGKQHTIVADLKTLEMFHGHCWQGCRLEVRKDTSLTEVVERQVVSTSATSSCEANADRQIFVNNVPFPTKTEIISLFSFCHMASCADTFLSVCRLNNGVQFH